MEAGLEPRRARRASVLRRGARARRVRGERGPRADGRAPRRGAPGGADRLLRRRRAARPRGGRARARPRARGDVRPGPARPGRGGARSSPSAAWRPSPGRHGVQVAVLSSAIAAGLDVPDGVVHLRSTYPICRYFRAFDAAVSAAGYNAFHELIRFGVPTLFVPMLRETDDQAARARFAAGPGVGLALEPGAGPERGARGAARSRARGSAMRERLDGAAARPTARPTAAAWLEELATAEAEAAPAGEPLAQVPAHARPGRRGPPRRSSRACRCTRRRSSSRRSSGRPRGPWSWPSASGQGERRACSPRASRGRRTRRSACCSSPTRSSWRPCGAAGVGPRARPGRARAPGGARRRALRGVRARPAGADPGRAPPPQARARGGRFGGGDPGRLRYPEPLSVSRLGVPSGRRHSPWRLPRPPASIAAGRRLRRPPGRPQAPTAPAGRRAAQPGRDRGPEVRHQRPALPPGPAPRDLDVEAEGAQLLHRGAQLAARPRLVRGHFDPDATVRGESSPNYTAYPQHLGVPERMHSMIPDAKLIYVVRDPLLRIASHWVHNYAKRREKGDLAATLAHPNTSYLIRSQYHMQLQQFLRYYDREQILVFQQSDFRRQRADSLRTIFEFLGVDPDFTHPSFERERHATARKTRATRLAARLERMSKSRRGRLLPPKIWFALDERLPLRTPDRAPRRPRGARRRGAARAARGRRAPARAGRPRLRGLVDLRDMSGGPAGGRRAGGYRRRPRIPPHLLLRRPGRRPDRRQPAPAGNDRGGRRVPGRGRPRASTACCSSAAR